MSFFAFMLPAIMSLTYTPLTTLGAPLSTDLLFQIIFRTLISFLLGIHTLLYIVNHIAVQEDLVRKKKGGVPTIQSTVSS